MLILQMTIVNIWKNTYLTQIEASFLNVEPKTFFVKFTECGLKHPRHCSRYNLQVSHLLFSVGSRSTFTCTLLSDNCHRYIVMQVLLIIRGSECSLYGVAHIRSLAWKLSVCHIFWKQLILAFIWLWKALYIKDSRASILHKNYEHWFSKWKQTYRPFASISSYVLLRKIQFSGCFS